MASGSNQRREIDAREDVRTGGCGGRKIVAEQRLASKAEGTDKATEHAKMIPRPKICTRISNKVHEANKNLIRPARLMKAQ